MSCPFVGRRPFVASTALALSLMATPAALAETCNDLNLNFPGFGVINVGNFGGRVASVAGNMASAITTAQTAFLLQSTAFVSGPGNAQPEQQGSGVWIRAVGGQVNVKNPSTTNFTFDIGFGLVGSGAVSCDTKVQTTFAGVQFGHDIARLNVNGWNFHLGTTAGYLESDGFTVGGNSVGGSFKSNVQSPFAGTYLVVSKGGFTADALLRFERYEATFDSPTQGITNQSINARGVTFAASAAYNITIPNSAWFVEPSGGVIISRTTIDEMQLGGFPNGFEGFPGPLRIAEMKSLIGRVGLRTGTTITGGAWVWQPFAAASVWHEFGDAPTATYESRINPGITGNYVGTSVGTYGQYSLGIAGQLVNTGWVAFARVDYRKGPILDGWDGTGGFRYHFTPTPAVALVGKSPVYKAAPVAAAHNWTGLYVGVSAGAAFARADMEIPTDFLGTPGLATPAARGGGFIGGGQIGYNWQLSPQWVGGIEGAFDWTNLNGAAACAPLGNDFINQPLWNTTCQFDSNWLATLTGRLGYVWGRALWYVRAGAAYTHQTISIKCNMTPDVFVIFDCPNSQGIADPTNLDGSLIANLGGIATSVSASTNRLGFTAGYGVEFAFTPQWSARAETNIYAFGNRSVTMVNGDVVNSKYQIVSAKVGLNYKLTGR